MNLPTAHRRGTRTINGDKTPVYEIEGLAGLWVKTDTLSGPWKPLPWKRWRAVLTYRGTKREFVFERVL